jgi:hypothetical protein
MLRWFETLPYVGAGQDIDVLVADQDLPVAESLLTPYRGLRPAQKVDLYTAGGLPRTTFGGVPYFSAELAARVLNRACCTAATRCRRRSTTWTPSRSTRPTQGCCLRPAAGRAGEVAGPGENRARPRAAVAAVVPGLELTLSALERHVAREGLAPPAEALGAYAAERLRLYGS